MTSQGYNLRFISLRNFVPPHGTISPMWWDKVSQAMGQIQNDTKK